MSAPSDVLPASGHSVTLRRLLQFLPVLLVLLSIACGFAACLLYTFNHDASYLLHAAGRMLAGATLYVDIPEINPPLIVWINVPISWLAAQAGIPDAAAFRSVIIALAIVSVAWSGLLLRGSLSYDQWWSWLAFGFFVALVLPGYEFGQREHIALICSLPYLAEAARRCDGHAASRMVQAGVAALAIVGLALKPHFLLVPALIESYAALRQRRLALGVIVATCMMLAYLAAAWLFAPHYLAMVRLLAFGYWGYSKGWGSFLGVPQFYATVALVALAFLTRPRAPRLSAVLSCAIAGFALAAIVQQKGWTYHWIGALSLAWMLFGISAVSAIAQRKVAGVSLTPAIVAGVAFLLSLQGLAAALAEGRKINPYPAQLEPVIRELGGGPVILFSSFQASFPLVTEPGIGSSTRFPTMSIVSAMESGKHTEAINWVHRSFAEDFYRQPPRLLLIETDERDSPPFDFISYFRRDVPELKEYRLVRRIPHFQIWAVPPAQR